MKNVLLALLLLSFCLPVAGQRKQNRNQVSSNASATATLEPSPPAAPVKSSDDFSGVFYMLLFFGVAIYFLPALNALFGRHHNAGAIVALNVLLGFTFVGWVIALV